MYANCTTELSAVKFEKKGLTRAKNRVELSHVVRVAQDKIGEEIMKNLTDVEIDKIVRDACHSDPVMVTGEYCLTVDEIRAILEALTPPASTQAVVEVPKAPHWYDRPQSSLNGKTAREGYAANPTYNGAQAVAPDRSAEPDDPMCLQNWLDNARYLLDTTPGAVRHRPGMGGENLLSSLIAAYISLRDSKAVAPAQVEQEPVAWMHLLAEGESGDSGWNIQFLLNRDEAESEQRQLGGDIEPLYTRPQAAQPAAQVVQNGLLFCDLKTDEEKYNFFLSGQAYASGVIAKAIQNDVAMAYKRCAGYQAAQVVARIARRLPAAST